MQKTTINKKIRRMESQLPKVMLADRHMILGELNRLKKIDFQKVDIQKTEESVSRLEKRFMDAARRKVRRKENRPKLIYNADLPIMAKKDAIIEAMINNPVIIVSGETGSGKTTQIPKFCLAAGRGIDGQIGCTQPRRIAATTVARRIAEELGEAVGRRVGYKIRFHDRVGRESYIKIMTDGILLAETLSDRRLNHYDTIIVDEAHERSLNIDLILGILKALIQQRSDLKVIITSATIDTEKFSNAFGDAPIIEVSGRLYPVEVRYSPLDAVLDQSGEQTYIEMAVKTAEALQRESAFGDILIFMPTEQDIREACDLIKPRAFKAVTILPLYARLSAADQTKVFSRPPGRKIIVATNIAETSITIPGIKYVIDSGLARIPQYTPRTRTTALPVLPISRSSADQRKGRCGRVENGVCIRLFSEEDYLTRPLFTLPEIRRANLAEVILKMIALKLDDIPAFPFIDRPAEKSIQDGFGLLVELDALERTDAPGRKKGNVRYVLTEIGKLMAKMPLDPRLSRMLIEAHKEGCIKEIAVIVSALSVQDPRERPADDTDRADRAHHVFLDPASDFITLLNIWKTYHEALQIDKTTAGIKRFCKTNFLSYKRLREWRDIHAQVSAILQEFDLKPLIRRTVKKRKPPRRRPAEKKKGTEPEIFSARYTAIHRSVLCGFLSNIAEKKEKNIFKAARGREVMIFPGSTLFNRAAPWVVAAEIVQTSRLFARTAANIDCGWLEDLGAEQCKYTYLHPRWDIRRGEVLATEQVSLYGLIIVPERTVAYGRINPDEASDIFCRALVKGEVKRPLAFMRHNQQIVDEIRGMENKLRRRDLFAGEKAVFQHYKEKLPGVCDIRTLEKRIKHNGGDHFLHLRKEDLLVYMPDEGELSLFPDNVALGKRKFHSTFCYEPGNHADGLTVEIPAALAGAVPPESTEWLVPGLLKEKITALIKGLPKEYRKKLLPVANSVGVIMDEMPKEKVSLPAALSRFISDRFDVNIPASAWPVKDLPDYLRMRILLTGPKGEELLAGRDPAVIRRDMTRIPEPEILDKINTRYEKKGIKSWDFGDLPDSVEIKDNHNAVWVCYPGLEIDADDNRCVNLRLFLNRDKALASHKRGVVALYKIRLSKDLKFLNKILRLPQALTAGANYFGGVKRVEQSLYDSVLNDLLYLNIRTPDDFESHARASAPALLEKGQDRLNCVSAVLKAVHSARTALYHLERTHRDNSEAIFFLETQRQALSRLVPLTFIDLYDNRRLMDVARYIEAISIRSHRGVTDLARDRSRSAEQGFYAGKLEALLTGLSALTSTDKRKAVEDFFWLVEEYKVSLFAQELKTSVPVSKKRLDAKLKEIEKLI